MQNMSGGKTALGLDNNVGALVCYLGNLVCFLGLIYSIIVVVTDKTNKLPRFHAFQSILLSVAGLVIGFPLWIIMLIVNMILRGGIISILFDGVVGLVALVFSLAIIYFIIMAAIKGFNGEIYKIPFIGDLADKYSS